VLSALFLSLLIIPAILLFLFSLLLPLDLAIVAAVIQAGITILAFALYFRGHKRKRGNFFKAVFSMFHLLIAVSIVAVIFFIIIPAKSRENHLAGTDLIRRFLQKNDILPPASDSTISDTPMEGEDLPAPAIIIEETDANPEI